MEYPFNFKTAKEVEDIVRNHGAIPATIAIVKGKIHVGLSENELDELAKVRIYNRKVIFEKNG
jgi:pseudouridine-5'-phosphate glycosidase